MFNKKGKIEYQLSRDFKSALRHFAYYYTNGTLPFVINDKKLLEDIDYRNELKYEASLVEQAYAIFANTIKIDSNGKVLNQTHAMTRAAQWIRFACRTENDDFEVKPEFEDWEVELY